MLACEQQNLDNKLYTTGIGAGGPLEIGSIRTTLERVGYAQRAFSSLANPRLGEESPSACCAADETAADSLVTLFLHGQALSTECVIQALAPSQLQMWEANGLLACDQERVVPLVALMPYRDLILASDRRGGPWLPGSSSVAGFSTVALRLAALTIRRPAGLTLNLVAGSGLHALLAAAHSEQVVAIDADPRAVDFCRFNAQLNDIDNITAIQGELFEPVAGSKFDLVVAQCSSLTGPAPFSTVEGPSTGEELARQIVTAMPGYLSAEGFGQVLGDWCQRYGQEWEHTPASWVALSSCSSWAMHWQSQLPEEYLEARLTTRERVEFQRQLDAWSKHYQQTGVESLITGLVSMRRSADGPGWFRATFGPQQLLPGADQDIEQGFGLQDYLEHPAYAKVLLQTSFKTSPFVRIRTLGEFDARGRRSTTLQLAKSRGLIVTVQITDVTRDIFNQCDGRDSLGQVLHQLAVQRGVGFEALVHESLDAIRQLIGDGFLSPVG